MTTYFSLQGAVFTSDDSGGSAQLLGTVRLRIVAEGGADPVTIYGAPSQSLTDILRVGLGPSYSDPTPHDAIVSVVGSGLPATQAWTYRFGVVTWSGGQILALIGQEAVSGREMFIPMSTGGTPFPGAGSSAALQSFLQSITSTVPYSGTVPALSALQGTFGENDIAVGGAGADDFSLGLGNDTAIGNAGLDEIYGGAGNDALYGGADNDRLYGDSGDDLMTGDAGADRMLGGLGNDRLIGGDLNDWQEGGDGNDTLYGGTHDDDQTGNAGNDVIYGDAGRDDITGGLGSDRLYGGAGADTIVADWGVDILFGGLDNDLIYADGYVFGGSSGGPDALDIIYGGAGHDRIQEGNGISGGVNRIMGDAGNDTINGTGADTVLGGAGNDLIERSGGNSRLDGQSGADRIRGGIGRDTILGGIGNDTLDASSANGSVVRGQAGRDLILGHHSGVNILDGGAGADTFVLALTSSPAQRSQVVGGSGIDTVDFTALDSVRDILRSAGRITIIGTEGGRVTFSGVERFDMQGYGIMTATQFFNYWDDLVG